MGFDSFKYFLLSMIFICLCSFSYSQTYPIYKSLPSIAILDQDSLFVDSEWGKKIIDIVENKVSQLATENRSIESELEVEELLLTKKRKSISKIDFDILANDFDKKVKSIRINQASKQNDINNFLNKNRKNFFDNITPILLIFIEELGVQVLLNKDTVALASTGSDITNVAINRINEQLIDIDIMP
ncbi:OmpH family outer membrane protein [Amylibacter sp.]|nr:OmpH family outer membrane protein [Amylibacter sp.]